jgi:anti-anti-sigma factor
MELVEHVRSGVVFLQPRERLTVENEGDLKAVLSQHLEAGRVRIVLDLAYVPYIDSCGLGTIAQAHLNMHRAGGWLKLQNVTGRNLQLLSVTRLLGVIGVFASERHVGERMGFRPDTYRVSSSSPLV